MLKDKIDLFGIRYSGKASKLGVNMAWKTLSDKFNSCTDDQQRIIGDLQALLKNIREQAETIYYSPQIGKIPKLYRNSSALILSLIEEFQKKNLVDL